MRYDSILQCADALETLAQFGRDRMLVYPTDGRNFPREMIEPVEQQTHILRCLIPGIFSAQEMDHLFQLHTALGKLSLKFNSNIWKDEVVLADAAWHKAREIAHVCATDLRGLPEWDGMAPVPSRIDLPIGTFGQKHFDNDDPLGVWDAEEYWDIHKRLGECSNRHGTTFPLVFDHRYHAAFSLADDHYNEQLYVYMSANEPDKVTVEWLSDLALTLRRYPYYAIDFGGFDGIILLFGHRVLVQGEKVERCASLDELAALMRRGKPDIKNKAQP